MTCFPFFLSAPPPTSSPSGGSDFISITVESFSSRSQSREWQLLLRRPCRSYCDHLQLRWKENDSFTPAAEGREASVCVCVGVCLDGCQQTNRTHYLPKELNSKKKKKKLKLKLSLVFITVWRTWECDQPWRKKPINPHPFALSLTHLHRHTKDVVLTESHGERQLCTNGGLQQQCAGEQEAK